MKSNILIVAIAISLLFACKKETLQEYNSAENIYLNYTNQDTLVYSFAYVQGTDKDTIMLPVIVSGKRVNHARSFSISVVDTSTTAVSGIHYEPLKDAYIMPADSGTVKIPVILKNIDPALTSKSVLLTIRVSGGADFETALPVKTRTKSITFSNRLEQPVWWSQWGEMKEYSRTKHQLFLIASGTIDLPDRRAPDAYLYTPRALYFIQNTRLFLDNPLEWIRLNPEKGYMTSARGDGTGDLNFYNVNAPDTKFYLRYYANVGRYIFIDEYNRQILL
ncbi:protein of unknown function [Pedobacter sp. ok626]|uniref:DUF4843 domain-containing protein n=1 Tax=Pedobacter sp. ok626 TaxID=1761882 RepID=UPI000887EB1D|nr:DUF4843 domain-containing protein [Pedobacter sp. ok626]SDJ34772.1 protein of unknown function [Pedobacter sp. ok626]